MIILIKAYYFIEFVLFYLSKLVQSNLYIAYDILTPNIKSYPGFINVPLIIQSDFGLLLFSNLLSMTPGTLSIDIDSDKNEIKVHVLYNKNQSVVLNEIQKIQNKIKRIIE